MANKLYPFSQLGVTSMFTREGDFGNMYRMFVSHYINIANHKAYVEVSEAGMEQPLETGGKYIQHAYVYRNRLINNLFEFVVL